MKYFQMRAATEEMWARQKSIHMPTTRISTASCGDDTSIWISDPTAEVFFWVILEELNIPINESDHRQVHLGMFDGLVLDDNL